MQRESVSTPRQRAPQGATNRAQLKAPPLTSPAPAATARTLAPPKTLLAAAAEASASRHPPASHAHTAASTPAASRPQSTVSRSSSQSSRSSRGGLRPCVRSIAHALKVPQSCNLHACAMHNPSRAAHRCSAAMPLTRATWLQRCATWVLWWTAGAAAHWQTLGYACVIH